MATVTELDAKVDEAAAATAKVIAAVVAVRAELTAAIANAADPAALQAIVDKLRRDVIDPANAAADTPAPASAAPPPA